MPTLTLPESVFFAKLRASREKSPTLPLASSSSSLLCLNSHSQKKKLKHGNPTSVSAFSRHSKQDKEWNVLSPRTPTINALDIPGLSLFYGENNKTTLGTRHFGDTSHDQISSGSKGCTRATCTFEDAAIRLMSTCRRLKLPMLIGLLTLLDPQQAMAGSDFTAELQSIPYLGDLGDISTGFASAFLLIFFSELGDKTFFIAALLAARNSGIIIFIGTFGALAAMTVISVVLGRTFHYVDDILPFRFGETDLPLDDIAAVCLLTYFGVSTLIDAASSDGQKTEDEQKEAEIAVSDFSGDGAGLLAAANTVLSTFLVVFVAEWGDKSFFSTIALAAASSPLGVIGGALAGHAAATLLAVLGGSLLGTFLSEKAVAYVGGTLFLVFAAVTLAEIVA